MKIKIRMNTFETNSSSAHTFIMRDFKKKIFKNELKIIEKEMQESAKYLNKKYKTDMFYNNETKKFSILITAEDFGCEGNYLIGWKEKIKYIVASIFANEKYFKKMNRLFRRLFKSFNGFLCVSDEYYFKFEDDDTSTFTFYSLEDNIIEGYGSIDHQSVDVVEKMLEAMKKEYGMNFYEAMTEILFNDSIIIATYSDSNIPFLSILRDLGILNNKITTKVLQYSEEKNDYVLEKINL